jgi:hypothetical protein
VPAGATDYLLHGAIVLRPCPKVLHQRLHLLPPQALRHPRIPPRAGGASLGQRRRHAPPTHNDSPLRQSFDSSLRQNLATRRPDLLSVPSERRLGRGEGVQRHTPARQRPRRTVAL